MGWAESALNVAAMFTFFLPSFLPMPADACTEGPRVAPNHDVSMSWP